MNKTIPPGQISRDGQANLIATGDLSGQVAQVLRNTAIGLAGAGATFADVVRLRFFMTQSTPEKLGDFMAGIELVAEEFRSRNHFRPSLSSGSTSSSNPTFSSKSRPTPSSTDAPGLRAIRGSSRAQ